MQTDITNRVALSFYTTEDKDFYRNVIRQVKPSKGGPSTRTRKGFLYLHGRSGENAQATLHHESGATVTILEKFLQGGAAYIAGTEDARNETYAALVNISKAKLRIERA